MLFALNWHERNTTFLTAEDTILQHRNIKAVTNSAMYRVTQKNRDLELQTTSPF